MSLLVTSYPWSWRPGSSHCWIWSCGFLRSTSPPSHLKVHDCLARSLGRRWWFPGWTASQTVGSLVGKECRRTHKHTGTCTPATHTHGQIYKNDWFDDHQPWIIDEFEENAQRYEGHYSHFKAPIRELRPCLSFTGSQCRKRQKTEEAPQCFSCCRHFLVCFL